MKRGIILLAVMMVGCATKPVTNEQAKNVPAKQIIDNTMLVVNDG